MHVLDWLFIQLVILLTVIIQTFHICFVDGLLSEKVEPQSLDKHAWTSLWPNSLAQFVIYVGVLNFLPLLLSEPL